MVPALPPRTRCSFGNPNLFRSRLVYFGVPGVDAGVGGGGVDGTEERLDDREREREEGGGDVAAGVAEEEGADEDGAVTEMRRPRRV
jgi:hypothetical protein